MRTYRLALIGFGNVGQGLAQILLEKQTVFAEQYGLAIQIVAISDMLKGAVYNPDGLDIQALLDSVNTDGTLSAMDAPHKDWDAIQTINETNADVVVELSYTDLKTGEPAFTHVKTAFESGKHVSTCNKGPVALFYPQLKKIADENDVYFGIEGTVMSGTPALQLGKDILLASGITGIEGILNGTSNYILSQMGDGMSYETALADAQERGYAEADPTGDVEGHDASGKVVILANLLMNANMTMADVDCDGITGISIQDIKNAKNENKVWKLIGSVEKENDTVKLGVKPQKIANTHPLASVSGATNAITYHTELLGDVTLIGAGAGRMETGYAIIEDLLAIHRR